MRLSLLLAYVASSAMAQQPRVNMICGNRADSSELDRFYQDSIAEAIKNGDNFILGAAVGVDTLAFDFIKKKIYDKNELVNRIVFHGRVPAFFRFKNGDQDIRISQLRKDGFRVITTEKSFLEVDNKMWAESTNVIACVESKYSFGSSTALSLFAQFARDNELVGVTRMDLRVIQVSLKEAGKNGDDIVSDASTRLAKVLIEKFGEFAIDALLSIPICHEHDEDLKRIIELTTNLLEAESDVDHNFAEMFDDT